MITKIKNPAVTSWAGAEEKDAYFEELRQFTDMKDMKFVNFSEQAETPGSSSAGYTAQPPPVRLALEKAAAPIPPCPKSPAPGTPAPPLPPNFLLAKQGKASLAKAVAEQPPEVVKAKTELTNRQRNYSRR